MRNKRRSWKERICALALAVMMVLSGIMPGVPAETAEAAGDKTTATIKVVDAVDQNIELSGVTVEIYPSEDKNAQDKIAPNKDGAYELNKDTKYFYKLSGKEGYTAVTNGTFETGKDDVSDVKLPMTVSKIAITIAEDTNMKVGETRTCGVSVPDAALSYVWTSDKPQVATVDGGVITAVGEGSANITASYGGITSNVITVQVSKIATQIGLTADPSTGVEKSSITLNVENLPEGATGKVEFYISNNGADQWVGNIESSQTTSWTYTSNDGLLGDYTFKAVYAGNQKYAGSTATADAKGFTKNQKIVFSEGKSQDAPKLVKFKENDKFQIEISEKESKIIGTLKYESLNPDVLEVAQNGQVTILKSGAAQIKVSIDKTGNYNETDSTYYVYVQEEYALENLADKIAVQDYTRVYNGSSEVTVTAYLNSENLAIFMGEADKTKQLKVTMTAAVESKDAAGYNKITAKEITEIVGYKADGTEADLPATVNNQITEVNGTTLSAKVNINQRTVYLGTTKHSVKYGTGVQNQLFNANGLVVEVKKAGEPNTGVVAGETVNFDVFKATADANIYNLGKHAAVIKVNTDWNTSSEDGYNDYPNYKFVEDNTRRGTLTVIKETLSAEQVLKNVTFAAADGESLYRPADNEVFISGGKLMATVTGTPEFQEFYDTVILVVGDKAVNLTNSGYDVSDVETGRIDGEIYLQKDGNVCEPVDFSFYVDKTAPDFTFGDWEEKTQVLDSWMGAITFNKYQKSYYTIDNVSQADDLGNTSDLGDVQSGVKEWSYHVYKVENDDQLKEAALQEYAKKVAWTKGEGTSIPVLTAESGELKAVQGNYIVLAKVTDNVGNSAVYSSNGVVFEVTSPVATILAADGTAIDKTKYYNDNVNYKVEFTDPGTTSGFASATIKVFDGEKELTDLEENVTFNEDKGYTLEELQKLAVKTVKDELEKTLDSNNLKIVVTAYDQAGNEIVAEQSVMIDSTQPKINVEFNNDADVKNGKYFKTDRVMTITYTEKNIDKSDAGITFDLVAGVGINPANANRVPLSGLGAYGISYAWETGSEDDKDVSEYTKDRTSKLILTFSEDKEYYIVPHCEDLAGNTESSLTYANDAAYAKEFVIDKTAPIINVAYDLGAVSTDDANRTYTSNTVNATVTITEQNFWNAKEEFSADPKQMNFGATTGTEAPNGIEDYQAAADAGTNWSRIATASEQTFIFEKDANYTFGFTYTDLAGNEAVYAPHYFTVDKTQPEGTISIDEQSVWSKIWAVITFNIFKNTTYDVTLTSTDVTAGVASTAYYKTRTPISDAQVKALADGKWTEGTSFKVSPNEQYVVYGRVIDRSGNVRFLYPTNGAVADNVEPTIDITNLSTPRNGIFRGDVTLKIDVTDPVAGDTYSGLEKVWYEVNSTGNVTNSKTEVLIDNSANRVQGSKDYSENIVISAADFNSNDVKVQVHAVDFSGNQYDSEIVPLKIDITAPTIQVTYDLNNPSNGKYYNATRTATVTVTERNFDENAVRFNITNTDGTQPAISGWSRSADAGVSDSAVNTCTVTFAADGDYTLTLNTTDLAGNESNYTQVDEFTIDKTVPTINVAFDNNSASNGRYYNAPRTATITVNEHNFNGSEVQTAISAALQSQGISAPGVNGWSTSGDVHTATVHFGTDGDYSFTVNYTDLAGNAATAQTVDTFTIDQTKPEIEIFDIEDKSANNGTVAPGVRYSDVNYNENDVTLTIKGPKHSSTTVDGTRSSIPNGQSIKMADFAHEESVDDVYTLTAQVTDMAGNSHEESVIFSVNRFGSNYVFSDSTEAFLDQYYSNSEESLVVTEINVDTLEHYGISYGRDGEMVKLEKGSDYTVKESGSEASWKSYQYTMKASNFEKEGLYNITIDSRDRAKNEVNNKVKGADIEFVIDKTAPTVVITGVEDDTQYRANNRDISVAVADNVAIGGMDVYVDDNETPIESFDAEAILKQKGEVPFTLDSSNDWQMLKAVAMDAAGNTAETSEYRVLITSNILVQFVRNTPLVIGSSVSLLAVAGVIILLIAKKKKKEEEA